MAAPVKAPPTSPAQLYHDHAMPLPMASLPRHAQPDRPGLTPKRAGYHRAEFVEGWRRAGRFRKEHSAPTQVEFHNPPANTFFLKDSTHGTVTVDSILKRVNTLLNDRTWVRWPKQGAVGLLQRCRQRRSC